MNELYLPNGNEHIKYENFELIYEGVKRKGIYLLEYHDSYLKDAFVTQLAEQFINKGCDALFIQEEKSHYSLENIFLTRTTFKQNPHDFPSLSQITQDNVALLTPHFKEQYNAFQQKISIIITESPHPSDYLRPMFQAIQDNPQIRMIIIDSHTDYFNKMNLIPQLSRLSYERNITILFTSPIATEKFFDHSIFLPSYIKNYFHLSSKYTDLYLRLDSKDTAFSFELNIRTPSNQRLKNYFTIRPASAYCQEG
jgi:hypothetical protein